MVGENKKGERREKGGETPPTGTPGSRRAKTARIRTRPGTRFFGLLKMVTTRAMLLLCEAS